MLPYLSRYPRTEAAIFLAEGFAYGFRIPCSLPLSGDSMPRNLKSTSQFPQVVTDKLAKEVEMGRMAGPFDRPPIPGLHVSPLGVVPKKEPHKFRLIHHLSYPKGSSVNDAIEPDLTSVSYTSFDTAVSWVQRYGQGALLAKTDIESAFRLLPVHPDSQPLLGCFWGGQFFVDRCLPMGCSISCSYFETFSTFVEWVVREESQVRSVLHYLDDFLCIGPPKSTVCSVLLRTLESVARRFGIPLAPEKTEGPSTEMQFLGIIIDTQAMECRLPTAKLEDLRLLVRAALQAKKVRLKQLQSLLGKLNFACRIMPMGRIFCRRLSAATSGVRMPHHFIRLSAEHKADLRVWEEFLATYNGRSLWMAPVVSAFDFDLYTDAAGSLGFGAYCQGAWCAEAWPEEWRVAGFLSNLVLLELFPIVVALDIWGSRFQNRRVCFHCDNMGVVAVVSSLSASSPPVVRLLRFLVLRCLSLNCFIKAVHVPGVENSIADALSRFQWDRFRKLAPAAEQRSVPCPRHLWRLALE